MENEGVGGGKRGMREALPTLALMLSSGVMMVIAGFVFPGMKENYASAPGFELNAFTAAVMGVRLEAWAIAAAAVVLLSLAEFAFFPRVRRSIALAVLFAAVLACIAIQAAALAVPAAGFL